MRENNKIKSLRRRHDYCRRFGPCGVLWRKIRALKSENYSTVQSNFSIIVKAPKKRGNQARQQAILTCVKANGQAQAGLAVIGQPDVASLPPRKHRQKGQSAGGWVAALDFS